jgi:tetratricopeptide (TPR) repeat protein
MPHRRVTGSGKKHRSKEKIPLAQEFQYIAFISYSHTDEKAAKWLHQKLESYRLPSAVKKSSIGRLPKYVRPIFRDEVDLSSGPLEKTLKDELGHSRFLIVMCSPRSAKSEWVDREVSHFISLRGIEFVIPIIVEGTPHAKREEYECLPPPLLRGGEDQLAIPFAGQSKEQVLLKTVAALLSIKYDKLYDRHRRRQRRLRMWGATGATAIFVIVLTAAIFSFLQWTRAEKRRVEAEQILNYLLVDIHPKLKQFGRLDILENVAEKSREYIDHISTDVSDPIDAIQAVSLRRNMAEVYQNIGKLDAAKDLRLKNLMVLKELAHIKSKVEIILLLQGEEHQALAGIRKTEGRFQDALKESQSAFAAFTSLVRTKDDPSWRSAKAGSEQRLADAYYDLDMGKLATKHIDSAISDFRKILRENSDTDGSYHLDLAYALVSKSKIAAKWGTISEAHPFFVEASDLFRRHLQEHPEDRTVWASFANVANYLAAKLKDMGRMEEAFHYWNLAIEAVRQLVTFEPLNVRWREALSETLMNKANALRRMGRSREGLLIYEEVIKQQQKLIALQPKVVQWRAMYAWCLHNSAIEQTRLGQTELAIDSWGKAIETLEQLRKEGRAKREWLIDLCNIYDQRATVAIKSGRKDIAAKDTKSSQTIRTSLLSDTDSSPRGLVQQGINHARAALLEYHRKDYKKAISLITAAEKSIRRAVEFDEANKEWSEHLVGALRNKGVIYRAAGLPKMAKTPFYECIMILEKLRARQPRDEKLIEDLSEAYNNLANSHCDLGNTEASVGAWEKSLEINADPGKGEFLFTRLGSLAYQYLLLDNMEKAEESARKALKVKIVPWIQINLGHALLLQDKRKAAKSQYARAIHQNKNAIDSIRADFVDLKKHGISVGNAKQMINEIRETREKLNDAKN